MIMLKKILSYLYPITLYKEKSSISETLEVTLYNGKYLLNTKNTNYSYGSLQTVLKKGLLEIGKNNISEMKHILILGVAGGSVVKTLVNDFNFSNKITGVELDQHVIDIANKYFNLNTFQNFECVIDDAQNFVEETPNKYDLIIIDIFNDKVMPAFLFENDFIHNTKNLLQKKGYILFNIMDSKIQKKIISENYFNHFEENEYVMKVIKNVERFNDLIIIHSVKK
ncbi:Spermine/spermidine synthase [Flavobacterium urocaniciphilum]|uniref:Spermine/spermidine synthase n=2 Tax=Flavobacterium urocaniciphilum TaxID=1299341 RepID=A0A1H8ZA03_9FLAO|nr:Spermine/spermidine synthase [Flavobacterium urocaniciphilum]